MTSVHVFCRSGGADLERLRQADDDYQVPVELPKGVQMEQGWSRDALQAPTVLAQSVVVTNGAAADVVSSYNYNAPISGPMMSRKAIAPSPPLPSNGTGTGAGIGAGSGGGMGGGTYWDGEEARSLTPHLRDQDYLQRMRALASKVRPQLLASYQSLAEN